jgi:hypothetical protein
MELAEPDICGNDDGVLLETLLGVDELESKGKGRPLRTEAWHESGDGVVRTKRPNQRGC